MKSLIDTYKLLAFGFMSMAIPITFGIVPTGGLMLLGLIVGMFALIFGVFMTKNTMLGNGMFMTFAFLVGVLINPQIIKYQEAASLAMFMTMFVFAGLSSYVVKTGKNFEGIGNYLMGALVLMIVIGIVNIFVGSSLVHLILSYVGVLVFSGFILYDTSDIIRNGHHRTTAMNAINMFLNIINLFTSLLNILGDD